MAPGSDAEVAGARKGTFGWSTWTTVRLIVRAAPWWGAAVLALVAIATLLSMALTVVTGNIVGVVSAIAGQGLSSPDGRLLVALLLALAGIGLVQTLLATAQNLLQQVLTARVERCTTRLILDACLQPHGIAHLEDPAFADEIRLARGETGGMHPAEAVVALRGIATMRLAVAGAAIVLVGFRWWVPVVMIGGSLWFVRWSNRVVDSLYVPIMRWTPALRRAAYFRQLALEPAAAKEIRVFGLPAWVIDRFAGGWTESMRSIWRERLRMRAEMAVAVGIVAASNLLVYTTLVRATFSGELSLAAFAVYVQFAMQLSSLGSAGDWYVALRKGAVAIGHLFGLGEKAFRLAPQLTGRLTDMSGMPANEIRFEGVSFTYPGTDRPIFIDLNLTITAGESLALVGENGAGKTTLVKLLCRMYDPDDGRILVDGVDLCDIDPTAWRDRLAVIFQDFSRFELPARDNVGFGSVRLASDQTELDRAARLAGVDTLIDGLDHGWDTILSRAYRGGTDLSGGQWQKIALARALLAARHGGVLVLDEPTANLDVRAEAELFDRFLELTTGTTSVLISHRFSTVRHASRIAVIEHGRVVEQGSHNLLIAAGGRYAYLFGLQAGRFAETDRV